MAVILPAPVRQDVNALARRVASAIPRPFRRSADITSIAEGQEAVRELGKIALEQENPNAIIALRFLRRLEEKTLGPLNRETVADADIFRSQIESVIGEVAKFKQNVIARAGGSDSIEGFDETEDRKNWSPGGCVSAGSQGTFARELPKTEPAADVRAPEPAEV